MRHYKIAAVLLQVGEDWIVSDPKSLLLLIVLQHVTLSDFHLFDALLFLQRDQLGVVSDVRLYVVKFVHRI